MVTKILFIFKGVLLFCPLFGLFICIVFSINKLWAIYKEQKKTLLVESELSILVGSYGISNFKKTFVILIVYLSLNFGLILSLRMSVLGSYRSIVNFRLETSLMLILFVLSVFILLFLMKKVLQQIAIKEVFKVYLYLYSKNYGKNILEYFYNSFYKSKKNLFIYKLYLLFSHIQPTYKLLNYTREQYANGDYYISLNNLDKMRNILSRLPWVSFYILNIAYLLSSLNDYWWPLRHYFVYFLSFIILIYDLSNERLYYFYFMLFIILLLTLYRDFLFFIGTKDFFVGDRVLSECLYKNKSLLLGVYYNEAILRDYLSNGYQKRTISDNSIEKVPSADPRFALVRRIYILVCLCILSQFALFYIPLLSTLLLTIPLVIMFNLMIKPSFLGISKKLYHKIYCLVGFFLLMINIWVYFRRHNYYYIQDTIWDKGIIIKQVFTLEEKRTFLYAYLNIVLENSVISAEAKGNILAKVTDEALAQSLTEETTIKQIKEYVELLPFYFFELERKYSLLFYRNTTSPEPFYMIYVITKILRWVNNIIHNIL